MQSKRRASQLAALVKARQARQEKSEEADDELYDLVNQMSGSSVYMLAKAIGWSVGKTHGSIKRLEKDGLIKTELVTSEGRARLIVRPTPWEKFFTKEELDEMQRPDFMNEVEAIVKRGL
jgi:DNA-binding PadR family transcriptional regulator